MSHGSRLRRFCHTLFCALLTIGFPSAALSQSAPAYSILATSDGRLIVGSDNGLHFHDAETLQRGRKIESKIEKIYSFKVSPSGKRVAVAGGTPSELGVVEIYSISEFERTYRFEQFDDVVTDVAWTSDQRIVACSMSGKCCVFDLNKESHYKESHYKESYDKESSDQQRSGRSTQKRFRVHSKGVLALEFLHDGHLVSCGIDTTIRVWKLDQAQDARILNNHLSIVNDIDVRHLSDKNAAQTIVSASDDGTVRFWQPTIGRMVRFVRLDSVPTCVIWNHDGTRAIAGCRDGAIRVIDPNTARVVGTIEVSSWIHCLARGINRDNVFVGSEDGVSVTRLKSMGR